MYVYSYLFIYFIYFRQHNVEENMTIAMEEAPESFGQVVMLYINCKVNGHPVKAFVDSGNKHEILIPDLSHVVSKTMYRSVTADNKTCWQSYGSPLFIFTAWVFV